MTAVYEKSGLRFLYPENWALDNREEEGQPWSVSVHSPTEAFWALTVYSGTQNLNKVGEEMLVALEKEYSDSFFEYRSAQQEIAGHVVSGYDIDFFYLDFLVTAKLVTFRIAQDACVVLYQGEQRDFEKLHLVFEAITHSLLSPDIDSPGN